MIDVRIVRSPQEREDAFRIRIDVFVREQGIPREEELDADDDRAVHCVAYRDGIAIGAGRLVEMDGYGKIGRMAVLASERGEGTGMAILRALEREGGARGIREFRLSAQLSARGFYDRAGYEGVGNVYDEVGIPHIAMVKKT